MLRNTITTAALLVAIALPAAATAADQGPVLVREYHADGLGYAKIVDDGDLSGTVSYTLNLTSGQGTELNGAGRYSRVRLTLDLTWAAASELQVTWKCSLDGTVFGTETSRDPTASVTLTSYQDNLEVTESVILNVSFGVTGCRRLTVDITSTGGTSDTVDVYAVATAGM